ncbi:AraC family transcriptional regulator [Ruminiclostridium papyrosolvens]|uniref:HTH araC/xylS-type domain-containing protein n=1 Tax=Ruminiclostridium papyrosolvens C7 TaxID=1330534 RepID=U4R080_9FIRM|nr:helix-turn-helix domain-containing protein [Ruminiclostridium papyrosolvens]EPR10846.1 hypothetical protein L323_12170 [Ruminiclostridium papyrosolvens C7]
MRFANEALVGDLVLYIENNLKTIISLDELSQHLCLSKYHLHRLIKSLAGITLMTYVRGRKLTSSLTELLETNLKIIDIANEYCFEYEQTYLRAFKRQFGISPSAYRRERCELDVVNKLDTSVLIDVSKGLFIKPRYILRPEFHLMGLQTFIINSENKENLSANKFARMFYFNERYKIKGCIKENIYYGLCWYGDNYEYGNFYIPSVEIENAVREQGTFICKTIPTSMYVVFRYIGFHGPEELNIRNLEEIYYYINYKWGPTTVYKRSGQYHFEMLDTKRCSDQYCEADIYIPIET